VAGRARPRAGDDSAEVKPPRQDTRERILDVAERLFAEKGFDGTSTARLADEAGVPQGLIFYYFKTKPEILLAIVNERPAGRAAVPTQVEPGQPMAALLQLVAEAFVEELHRHRYTRIVLFR